ncbi:hypothetical protein I79_013000 [Cricetulus griseus]|uniref:Uncharacterized protein n=1 Tax=Cricetulus griseus TaxID=10029 RepID=G3HQA4_CRIGR|nr:hypothetical protein I79_013000 [Cricetulus griseus]
MHGKVKRKAAHWDRVQKGADSATSSHPQPAEPSACRPKRPVLPTSLQDAVRGAGGTKGRTWLLPGVEVHGSKFAARSGGDASAVEHAAPTPSFSPRLRPHLSVSGEAGSARSRALPVAALGNRVNPGQK